MPEFFVWPLALSLPLTIWLVGALRERSAARRHLRVLAVHFEHARLDGTALRGELAGATVTVALSGDRLAVKVTGGRWAPPEATMRRRRRDEVGHLECEAVVTTGAPLFWAALGPPPTLQGPEVVLTVREASWVLSVPARPRSAAQRTVAEAVAWMSRAQQLAAGDEQAWGAAALNRLAGAGRPTTAVVLLHALWPVAANDDALRERVEATLDRVLDRAPAADWTRVASSVWRDLTATSA